MTSEETSNASSKTGHCHACNGIVSKQAKSCPHCGEKKPYKGEGKKSGLWPAIFIVFGFFYLMSQIGQMFVPVEERVARNDVPMGYGTEAKAREMCEKAIYASVNNPSTVNIESVLGYGTNVDEVGTRRITQSFSAKNSFGLKKNFDAYCSVKSDGTFDINIVEQGR